MIIKRKIALDLIYCYKQINACNLKEIIVIQDSPYNGQYAVLNIENKYYITRSSDLLEESKDINNFIEDFYYRINKGEIIIYPIKFIDDIEMRFDGFLFITYDKKSRKPSALSFNEVSPEVRRKYFEKVLNHVV